MLYRWNCSRKPWAERRYPPRDDFYGSPGEPEICAWRTGRTDGHPGCLQCGESFQRRRCEPALHAGRYADRSFRSAPVTIRFEIELVGISHGLNGFNELDPLNPFNPWLILLHFRENLLGQDPVNDADFAGPAVGIHILPGVFLRQFVDVGICTVFGDFDDLSLQRNMAVRVLRILNADRNVRIPPHIAVFDTALRAVDHDVLSIIFTPD